MLIQKRDVDVLELRDDRKTKRRMSKAKKHLAYDLGGIYQEAVNRLDSSEATDKQVKTSMKIVVDGYVRSALLGMMMRTLAFDNSLRKPSRDDTRLVRAMITRYPTLVGSSLISAIRLSLRHAPMIDMDYSDAIIAEYVCREFNKCRDKFGIYAYINYDDVVLDIDPNISKRQARNLVNRIID
jgi:hypothetical protein